MRSFGNQRVKVGEYSNGKAKYVTRRHYAKIKLAEKQLGYPLTIVQGSYHKGVEASKGTHDGGGCLDLAPFEWERKSRIFRKLGDAAWHRIKNDDWNEHVHTVDLGCTNLQWLAKDQTRDYRNGDNGLGGNSKAKDTQWRPDPIPHFKLTAQLIAAYWPQLKPRRVNRVDLHKVLAQVAAGGTRINPGVKLIQRALNKALPSHHLLVDGKFGEVTKKVYAAWQRSLGFTGSAAEGVPVPADLKKLGQVRGAKFVVSN
jgi:hypothetical protein